HVKELLPLADKDIEDHDFEIRRLRHQIMIIEQQKQQLEAQRAKLRALVSPVRTLPNEILSRILQHVCIYDYDDDEDGVHTPFIAHFPAMVLSSVCSRWRQLALSSPSLWASLTVDIQDIDVLIYELSFIVTQYVERSGECPLKLSLNFRYHLGPDEEPSSLAFFRLLLRHAHRWETFKFQANNSMSFYNMLSRMQLPSLLELDIRSPAIDTDGDQFPELDLLEIAPRLCALATIESPPTKVPFHPLQTIHLCIGEELASPPVPLLAKILHNYPSLKSLSLEIEPFDVEDLDSEVEDPMVQGTWCNITCLVIRTFWEPSWLKMLFSSFRFPSLNEVVLKDESTETWPTDDFISFVTSSSYLDLIAVLRVMPSISYLEIDDLEYSSESPITSHFMQSLRHQSTSSPLAPKLHSLRLISEREELFDDVTFISMVESRWFKPGSDLSAAMFSLGKACLRSVVLKFSWREVDAEVYQPLRKLDAEGLRVVVAGTNGVQV
ncbi:hypothetical protein BDP27DRAFT_1334733, partial [Rhodocollybia butyracea]